MEKNESYERALIREIKEELNADIEVNEYIGESIYHYPEKDIKLFFYVAKLLSEKIELLEHESYKWITKDGKDKYEYAGEDKIVFDLGGMNMQNLFIEYPKCSTCQKAKKWLEENDIKFDDRHIVENNPTEEELSKWIKLSNKEIKNWFNTSGLKYRELNLKDKLSSMSDTEKFKLLASDGMLVKRPIIVNDKGILIGFKEKEWKDLLVG